MTDTKHLILVEDDNKLSFLIKDYLSKNGFTVDVYADGITAVEQIKAQSADLVILDVMLPGKDGFEICREIRPDYIGPVLFLTAKGSDFDQVLGLELGADDYVIKPVEPRVLLARIQALLRRANSKEANKQEQHEFNYGGLSVHGLARTVILDGQSIELTSHEFDMLLLLVKHPGEILSRDFMSINLIGREYDGLDRSIDVRLSKLRKKLGDSSDAPFRFKTIWGKGYLFVPDAW